MVALSSAAPPTPWSKSLTTPKINETAYVHSFSNIIGDVRIGANVLIAPGTSIRADEGSPFYIGKGTNVQDGVVVHGLERGRVIGDDNQAYSVWIGDNASITHMALIHGPAYIGNDCFIGFRSTVFNARVSQGSVVMMHVLIQDVEIPPGKYVASGSVITNQQQADRLPDVQADDIKFATHVLGINDALRSGYHCADDVSCIASVRDKMTRAYESSELPAVNTHLSADVVQQVRQLLAQNLRIGTEHADTRRFQSASWTSCQPIQATRESEVLAALDACLDEHSGDYVRLIGIDPEAKRRVLETIIQRPNTRTGEQTRSASATHTSSADRAHLHTGNASTSQSNSLNQDAIAQVRQWLTQGYQIGAEHADKRRFQTSSWQNCGAINVKREADVMAALERCTSDHSGEYVRVVGIDPQAKRRVGELIIQRPGTSFAASTQQTYGGSAPQSAYTGNSSGTAPTSTSLSQEAIAQVRQLLAQGHQIGVEHADKRRFQTSSWQSGGAIDAKREADVIAALERCIADHHGEYVRLIGIDAQAKRRVTELIILRPGTAPSDGSTAPESSASFGSSNVGSSSRDASAATTLSQEVVQQVRQALSQGYQISTEYADERRFKTSSWQTGGVIHTKREAEVLASLEATVADHSRAYVRLVGTDPNAKRRVLETTIKRPSK